MAIASSKAPSATDVLRSLSAAEIRQKLAEMDGEAKALRTLLRAAVQAERGRAKPDRQEAGRA